MVVCSLDVKYKSSEGVLTMETSVGQMIYYLIKKQPFN